MDRNITDFDIQALVDDELDWEAGKRIRDYISKDPGAKKRYEELKLQKQLIATWWQRLC